MAILNHGKLVVLGSPAALVREVGGDVVTLETDEAAALAGEIAERFGARAIADGGLVRLDHARGPELLPELLRAYGNRVRSARISHPTLEDVFFERTGRSFAAEEGEGLE